MNELFHFSIASLSALMMFAFVSSITPGPNNLMLLYSGARFGFRHSLPHLLGVSLGFGLMLLLCCLGVAGLFWKIPHAQDALKIAGCAYMLWLAYKLWLNGALPRDGDLPTAQNKGSARPMTFVQASLFQYVNPKAWVMGLTVPAAFLPNDGHLLISTLVATIIFVCINLLCCGSWVQGGALLQKLMHKPTLARLINGVIVVMTVYCAVAVWL
ncbi:LysE family translocator [Hydromonas duriensis]|uniref:Threonine/homoserine/homoserine lactone efflux protein n=1 Tax=Hydromonas duriensis TaxID=1527608 RepID=A0A4R6Y996_9BURK|nr:LysE family translocator [Hydromonas duriensis]TDR31993.1 threonine/homoserine/homoserine lactone efflux protein [Hydromonas duriensis]